MWARNSFLLVGVVVDILREVKWGRRGEQGIRVGVLVGLGRLVLEVARVVVVLLLWGREVESDRCCCR